MYHKSVDILILSAKLHKLIVIYQFYKHFFTLLKHFYHQNILFVKKHQYIDIILTIKNRASNKQKSTDWDETAVT